MSSGLPTFSLNVQRRAVLGLLLLFLSGLLARQDPGHGPFGIDGSYYLNMARHVAEGDGLVTSVCLYHQGLPALPAKTNIYPLWPLLLGAAGRMAGVERVAFLLPRVLVILDLLLLYFLTLRLGTRLLGADRLAVHSRFPWIDYGHLAVLFFGFNATLFSTVCYPYTEGLAFFLLFASILLLDEACTRDSTSQFVLAGLVAGAAFLTRSQLLFVGLAIGFLLVVFIAVDRRFVRSAAGFLAGWLAAVGPWVFYLTTFIKPFSPAALLSSYRATPGLPSYELHVRTSGALAYLLDAASGLLVAFNPLSTMSFVHSFGVAAELVLLAGVHFAVRRLRGGLGPRPDRNSLVPMAVLLIGLSTSFSLLLSHNRFFLEWLFGFRHGLPFILLLVLSLFELIGRGEGVIRFGSLLLVLFSLVTNVLNTVNQAAIPPAAWPSVAESKVSLWLAQHDPHAIVLSTNAQSLSVLSRANFRWAACTESSEDVRRVLQLVRTDYVLAYETERACPFLRGLQNDLRPVAAFGAPPNRIELLKVIVPRETPSPHAADMPPSDSTSR